MARSRFAALAALATVLALTVVVLGAYVRLSHAGLGCPDWPGCYGHLTVPDRPEAVAAANASYPERPLHSAKAWKEMVHRYLASGLGLSILVYLAKGSIVNALIMVCLGLFIGTVGLDPMSGISRLLSD